jgi:protein-disulfide isomerase
VRSSWVPRLALGAGAVALIYVIVSISVGESGPQARPPEEIGEVQRLYGGIAQEERRLGPVDAPVEVELFIDLRCVECADYQREVIAPLIEEHVRTDDALIELRHFSVAGPEVTLAAIGAAAAGEQGRQWQFAELVLRNLDLAGPTGADREFLDKIAEATPELDEDQWAEDLELPATRRIIEADADLALELRLPAEPAVFVAGPGGSEELVQSPALDEIEAAIAAVS